MGDPYYRRTVSLLVVVCMLIGLAAPAAWAVNGSETASSSRFSKTAIVTPEAAIENVALSAHRNAGGWGLKSALIFAGTSAVVNYVRAKRHGSAFNLASVFDFAKQGRFWGGLAGDMAFSMVAVHMASFLPGGVFLKTLFTVTAGFVGWEVGTGNLANTDWLSISLQALAATATYLATGALLAPLGLPFAGLVATVASIGAALGTAYLLEKFRQRGSIKAALRPESLTSDGKTANAFSDRGAGDPSYDGADCDIVQLRAERNAVYLKFHDSVMKGDREKSRELLRYYRSLDDKIRALRAATGGNTR